MTRDELMALARQAGHIPDRFTSASTLERFAALVRADERKACAKFLERGVDMAGLAGDTVMQKYTAELLLGCAAAIRARKEKQ